MHLFDLYLKKSTIFLNNSFISNSQYWICFNDNQYLTKHSILFVVNRLKI